MILAHFYGMSAEISGADARALALTSDSKIILVGTINEDKQNIFGIIRYLDTGLIDTDFGTDGIATITIGEQAEANTVAVDSNNKIVVGGFALESSIIKVISARYLTDGSLDVSYGPDNTGINVETAVQDAQIADLRIQADGKIIFAGTQSIEGQLSVFLMRYTTDGILDNTFGNNGVVNSTVGYHTGALALALQADGKILVTGFSIIDTRQIIVLRFNADGSIDSSYGDNGLSTAVVGQSSQAEAIALDGDGKAVISGISDNQFVVARFNTNGAIDQTFGIQGVVVSNIGTRSSALAVAIQSDQKIVTCGFADEMFALARYNANGDLDTNFNGVGYITKLLNNTGNSAKAILLDANQKILIAGSAQDDLGILRFNADGSIDNTWSYNGLIETPSGSTNPATMIFDQKASGVDGGTFTAGSWITRELNQIITNSSNVILDSNRITLYPGTYEVSASAPAFMCGKHKIRLQNVTTDVTEKNGSAAYSSSSGDGSVSSSLLEVTLVVTDTTDYEIQHRCSNTKTGTGLGISTGFDDSEVYTMVKITEK
jgi:uncharacterized delta-60 repeat protein